MTDDQPLTSLVFSGGLGLGAYHGGAFEAFEALSLPLDWVTGSSAGAVTAALVAGSPPESRLPNLRAFWQAGATDSVAPHPWRHGLAWMSAIGTHLVGSAGFFHPRVPLPTSRFNGLYDMTPARERLHALIDFGRLNAGDVRITIAATDLETGDPVLFDSRSEKIEMDHILASCGFLPEFGPIAIGDNWLGDGGFSLNAPFDPVIDQERPIRLYVIDLYARDGNVPNGLEAAVERKSDLLFGNQTYQRLRYALEARRLRARLQGFTPHDTIFLISYRPGAEEAGPEKSFDLSRVAMTQRWCAGFLDMQAIAAAHTCTDGIYVVRRRS
jgi:NTE family protein